MSNPARAQVSLQTPPQLDGARDAAASPRLVALDEGSDILLDRPMLVVGRHPQCDTRLDSIRVSRRHCCLNPDGDGIVVRDLGSTNGIRINGRRMEMGRLRPGDELSIAHIRYRLVDGVAHEPTLPEPSSGGALPVSESRTTQGHSGSSEDVPAAGPHAAEDAVAAAVRGLLPSSLADRYRIQVIVQRNPDADGEERSDPCRPGSSR